MKDLNYWKKNAEEDYITTPISVLRYITELENKHETKQLNILGVSNSVLLNELFYESGNGIYFKWRDEVDIKTILTDFNTKPEDFENIEKLADIQHQIWSHWMKYLFSKCRPQKLTSISHKTKQEETFETGNYLIPKELVNRWIKQMNTDYKDLTDKEKESDREQVRKFIEYLF